MAAHHRLPRVAASAAGGDGGAEWGRRREGLGGSVATRRASWVAARRIPRLVTSADGGGRDAYGWTTGGVTAAGAGEATGGAVG